HVSAAASGLGEGPALLAMSPKMGRISPLIPLVLWFQSLRGPGNPKQVSTDSPFSKILDLLGGVPYYVGGFVLCALATNLVPWPNWFLSSIKNLTQWMLWIALAAIGMNIRISQVLHQGRGALVPALGMFVFQILLVLGWLIFLKL
ncbi:MAG: putative sulfate exporter family transporter, partial [Bacteroidota bacterium]